MRYAVAFGVDPWRVWTEVPLWFVEAAHKAIPMLRAEESLRRAQEVQVGTGSFKNPSDARAVAQRWQRDAMGRGSAPQSKRGFERMMMAMGIRGRAG